MTNRSKRIVSALKKNQQLLLLAIYNVADLNMYVFMYLAKQ
jgi:hypothetical protein